MSVKDLSEFSKIIVPLLGRLGASDEVIYIFKKTGLLVSEANVPLLSEEQLRAVERATVEYRLLSAEMSMTRH